MALKNVIAIAAGMAEGLGVGDNTKAMVVTRGLAEMIRLGEALGADPRTFAGLTGLGDLMATCSSPLSRNRHVGEQIALGKTVEQITSEMNMVAEGVKSVRVVCELAEQYGVDMPIAREVDGVVNEGTHRRRRLPRTASDRPDLGDPRARLTHSGPGSTRQEFFKIAPVRTDLSTVNVALKSAPRAARHLRDRARSRRPRP